MEEYRGRKILNLLAGKNGKVLDIGGGKNNLFFKFNDYTSIDIRNYEGVNNIILMDMNEVGQLPFPDNSFDVVLATEVLEHLFRPDKMSIEINRIAREDSLIIISLPNETAYGCRFGFLFGKVLNEGFNLYSHKYLFDVKKAEHFVKENFNVLEVRYALMGVGSEFLPWFLRDLLANLWPNMFAKSVIFKCRKKKAP